MNRNMLIIICSTLVLFGVIMRLVPHTPNMTPVAAIAIVASLYLGRWWSLVLPITVLSLSDVTIGSYDWHIMLSVYGSFALIGVLSWTTIKYRSVLSVGVTAISGSLLFFLVTNAAVWAFSPWYAKTFPGLLYAYEMGLPFLRNMMVGDIFYTGLLIITFETVCYFAFTKRYLSIPTQVSA